MAVDTIDRQYLSRYSQPTFAIGVEVAAAPHAADAPPVVHYVKYAPDGSSTTTWTRTATADPVVGTYTITLSSIDTAVPEAATLIWEYTLSSVPQMYGIDILVGPSAPAYDALSQNWQQVVEQVWQRFADGFDSTLGGPNLQTYIQAHFGRNRLAQLLPVALQTLNTASQPHYSAEFNGTDFDFANWGGLLVKSLYIETIKHLIRSYTEQPEAVLGTMVSRLDRRDYMDRWATVLNIEDVQFQTDVKRYRTSQMGFNSHVLVAGGAYGSYYNDFVTPGGFGNAAARGYYFYSRYH